MNPTDIDTAHPQLRMGFFVLIYAHIYKGNNFTIVKTYCSIIE